MDYDAGSHDTPKETSYMNHKLEQEALDTEFRKEFPPDHQIGSETDEAARVWKVYRKEAEAFDNGLLEGWSATVDILLIFAGLFSAVATAFVIESYQLLHADDAAYIATAVYILVAASNHTTEITLPAPPDLAYKSPLSRWINGLWFTSLLLALTVAFLSILVKQWITEYRARNRASARTPRDWARRREVYFQALNSWPVEEVVSFLPVLLHLSVFLFFAGVVAFLWILDQVIGVWIMFLGISLAVFYLGCTFIPLWVPECPTSTPLVHLMRRGPLTVVIASLRILNCACIASLRVIVATRAIVVHCLARVRQALSFAASTPRTILPVSLHPLVPVTRGSSPFPRFEEAIHSVQALRSDKTAIANRLHQTSDLLDASALRWLLTDVSDSDAVAVSIQALGSLHPGSSCAAILRRCDPLALFLEDAAFTRSATGHSSPAEVLRVVRSRLCMGIPSDMSHEERHRMTVLLRTVRDTEYPDLAILTAPEDYTHGVDHWRKVSPSLQSTTLLALQVFTSPPWKPLLFLTYYDLTQFSSYDWDISLRTMISTSDHYRSALGSADFPESLQRLGLAAIIAAVSKGCNFSNEHRMLADSLIGRTLHTVSTRSPKESISEAARQLLLDFMDSATFMSQAHEPGLLNYIAEWLCWTAHDAMKSRRTRTKFWTVLAYVSLTDSTPTADLGMDLVNRSSTLNWSIVACTNALYASWGSGRRLSAALNAILRPSASYSTLNQSLLQMLVSTTNRDVIHMDPGSVPRLAEILAAALCACVQIGQTPSQTSELLDAFFEDLPADFAHDLCGWVIYAPAADRREARDRVAHLVQHCVELRVQWWIDARAAVVWNGHLSIVLSEIDEKVKRLGRCQDCIKRLSSLADGSTTLSP